MILPVKNIGDAKVNMLTISNGISQHENISF